VRGPGRQPAGVLRPARNARRCEDLSRFGAHCVETPALQSKRRPFALTLLQLNPSARRSGFPEGALNLKRLLVLKQSFSIEVGLEVNRQCFLPGHATAFGHTPNDTLRLSLLSGCGPTNLGNTVSYQLDAFDTRFSCYFIILRPGSLRRYRIKQVIDSGVIANLRRT